MIFFPHTGCPVGPSVLFVKGFSQGNALIDEYVDGSTGFG